MERLGSLDAMFIAAEDATNHMHIGSVGLFEGPSPGFAAVSAVVRAKIPLVPRYHQRVREAPLSVGRPLWIDDPGLDLDYHLRHTALPPDDPDALDHLVARVMSQPLDRARPLWEMWMVEGLADGGWALVSKVHHCMVDGIAGTDLLATRLDLTPDAPVGPARPWTWSGPPSHLALAWSTATGAAEAVREITAGLLGALIHPSRTFGHARDVATGIAQLLGPRDHAAGTLTGPIGPHRRWTRTEASLADVATIRHAFGGTVNDVVLAAVARGFRALLESRDALADAETVSSIVPVSLRAADARGVFDNRVAALRALLPVAIEDPVATLAAVRAHLDELKRSHEVDASATLDTLGDVLPPTLAAATARLAVHRQELFQTVTTNVPGPQFPLYLAGAKVLATYPVSVIVDGMGVNITVMSYCGSLDIGIVADRDQVPDVDKLIDYLGAELAVLNRAST
jgi:diacylglycerol O-acyltransferase